MTDLAGRAADLLDRLEVTRLASGDVTAFDCYSKDVREAFRNCAAALADALHKAYAGTAANMVLPVTAQQLAGPMATVKEAASSQRSAQLERLDKALCELAKMVAGDGAGSSRLEALEALVGQLQAMRLLEHAEAQKQPQKVPAAPPQQDKAPPPKPQPSPEDPQMASAISDCLRSLGDVLGVPAGTQSPAPAGGDAQSGGGGAAATTSAVAKKVAELVAQLPADFFKPLVAPGSLDTAQVEDLNEVAQALQTEYTVRRRMLLERLKVTLQSFMWSPKLKEMDDGQRQEVENAVSAGLSRLQPTPSVQVGDVYSVTGGDVAAVVAQRTVSGSAMGALNASVKSVMIGKVPDRGGRTEGRAKEAHMPDWKPRSGGGGGGGGGGRGGGGGGNRGGGSGKGQQYQQGGRGGAAMRPQSAPQHAPVYVGAGPGVGGQSLAMGYGTPQYYPITNYCTHQQYVAQQQQQQQQQLMAQHVAMAAMGYVPQGPVHPQSAGGGGRRGGGRVQGSWQGQGGRGGNRAGGWGGVKRGRS